MRARLLCFFMAALAAMLLTDCASSRSGGTAAGGRSSAASVANQPVPESFALIPAGEFQMGDSFGDGQKQEIPVHNVYVSAFYMGKTEVTYGQWKEIYDWAKNHGYSFDNAGKGKADNHPIYAISWHDAVKWCNAKSEMEGLTPVYCTASDKIIAYKTWRIDLDNDSVKWKANGYRLPTEAEWEKAARGSLVGKRFPWGDTITHNDANYYCDKDDSRDEGHPYSSYDLSSTGGYHPIYDDGDCPPTSPVGAFAANGYGLYDMAGNVNEWCWDYFGDYSVVSQTDPLGPSSGSAHVFRGGSYDGYAHSERCAYRNIHVSYDCLIVGFRVAHSAVQK